MLQEQDSDAASEGLSNLSEATGGISIVSAVCSPILLPSSTVATDGSDVLYIDVIKTFASHIFIRL